MTHIVRHIETLAAFNLPDGRGFRVNQHSENGVVVRVEGVFLSGPVATDESQDGDSIDALLIYEGNSED